MNAGLPAILTDIEGTTTEIAFVRDALFPHARAALRDFLRARREDPQVSAALWQVRHRFPEAMSEEGAVALLQRWIDEDSKETPLKVLQGLIWEEGYQSGQLRAPVYPDAVRALRAWKRAGHALYVYSSGSEAAQRLLFAHSVAGDLTPLFSGYFDTRIGPKLLADSYHRIADAIGPEPRAEAPAILFLSDHAGEIAAARAAGLRAVRVDRGMSPRATAKMVDGVAVVGSFARIDPNAADGVKRRAA
jgi:enolase-phosphatase E1